MQFWGPNLVRIMLKKNKKQSFKRSYLLFSVFLYIFAPELNLL